MTEAGTTPEATDGSESTATSFAVVGGGYRTGFFLRAARELPDRLRVSGVVTRRSENGAELERDWGVPTSRTLDALLEGGSPDFVVVSVAKDASAEVIADVVAHGLPVLAETPPAVDVAGLTELHRLVQNGARIQVAEQYHLEPLIRAQIAVARSGQLGRVTSAAVSVAHDYHGISVLRRLLGVGFDNAEVTGHQFSARVQAGPDRRGDPREERWAAELSVSGRFDFGDRLGTYDFIGDQYRSWLRSPSLLVRGELGELRDEEVRSLRDWRTPLRQSITRLAAGGAGSHEGLFLRSLVLGGDTVYENEFLPARLADDELSVATLLARMGDYVRGGPEVYGLAEACQDQYLQLVMHQAIEARTSIRTETQPWAE
jgi:hypothetical protein